MTTPTTTELPRTMTVEQAGEALGISRWLAYEGVRRGDIPSVRIGRRVLVPRRALLKLLGEELADTPTTKGS